MKKIIAIISCIAVLSAVCVLSAFAYERTEEITFETLEISEREERTEKNNGFRSVETVEYNQLYKFDNVFVNGNTSNNTYNVNGILYIGNNEIEFTSITVNYQSSIIHYITIGSETIGSNNYTNYKIKFTSGDIQFSTILKNALIPITEMDNVYDNSGYFLGFITDTLTDLVDYMVTNNLILIVMAIVIVSFGIGVLIRITKVK